MAGMLNTRPGGVPNGATAGLAKTAAFQQRPAAPQPQGQPAPQPAPPAPTGRPIATGPSAASPPGQSVPQGGAQGGASPQQLPSPGPLDDSDGDEKQASPAESDVMKKFYANCLHVAFDQRVMPQLVSTLKNGDPVSALAHATVMIVIRVEDGAPQQIDPQIVFQAGAELLSELATVAGKMRIHDYSQDEINKAFLLAVDLYRQIRQKQGKLNPAVYQQRMQEMKQAETNGTLDKVVPGVTQFAAKVSTGSAAPGAHKFVAANKARGPASGAGLLNQPQPQPAGGV